MDATKPMRETHHQVGEQNGASAANGLTSMEQVRRLIRLLDQSDVAELELARPAEGTRLVLRKAAAKNDGALPVSMPVAAPPQDADPEQPRDEQEARAYVPAHLVGIFHLWLKPKGGALVAVGDHVKVGQLVASIESLNIINEVESPVAGMVVEILAQEGQPVEYGQPLIAIVPGEDEGAE